MATISPAPGRWRFLTQESTGTSADRASSAWSTFKEDCDPPPALGGVRLLREIGHGGMGRVYLGHHPILDIQVAVKVMLDHRDDRERFLNEVRLAARVDDEHLVRVLHAGEEDDVLYLVMEYVPGRTLRQLVQEQGRLPWTDAAQYILQAARGLAAVHRHGIIHCDVKPANMLLDPAGTVKVSDLGLARTVLGPSHDSAHVVGTPAFMAPEQVAEPRCVTTATDVYGLGASLYHLITGENPYPVRDISDVLEAHRKAPVPDIRRHAAGVPDGVADLVRRMLAREPGLRPLDGAAVVGEIERALGIATVSTSVRRPSGTDAPAAAGGRRLWTIGLGGAVLAGAVLLGSGHPTAVGPRPAAGAAGPPPAAAAAQVADPWRTPPRAVFVLAEHLPAAARAAIDEACGSSGLPVVERERIDALVREQELAAGGRIDPATAGRIARLVGGHIALFAAGIEDRIELRTVLVETGEIVASRVVAPAEVGAAAAAGILAATRLLPVQAMVAADGTALDAGARNGLRPGDRLELRRAPDATAFAEAMVVTTAPGKATLALTPATAAAAGAYAVRQEP